MLLLYQLICFFHVNDFRVIEKDWGADFRKLSAAAALVALTLWLDQMQVGAPNNVICSFMC